MPRGPRVDAPGTAHHVMIRGIERRRIFRDAEDCEAFLVRLARLVPELGFRCFAWALMPNHVHLALQTGPVPLPRLMARLGTGYARAFNRRHDRVGHLFQNRYKSRRVVDDEDLLGLVLYIHRNPVRAGLVAGPGAVGSYHWCGHATLAGERPPRPFESPAATLRLFAEDVGEARRRLRHRMEAPEQPSGQADTGIERKSAGAYASREYRPSAPSLSELIRAVAGAHGLAPEDLGPGRRSRLVVAARCEIARRATSELGLTSRSIAHALSVSDSTIARALARGPGCEQPRS